MKKPFIAFCILVSIVGCKAPDEQRHVKFDTFDFTFEDVFSTCFSIKFTKSDTAFVYQYFVGHGSDTLKENMAYVGLMTDLDVAKLDSFYNSVNIFLFDSVYSDGSQDAETYQFFVKEGGNRKVIFVHGEGVPKQLSEFAFWIASMKRGIHFISIDSSLSFESARKVAPPYVEPPHIRTFKTPKIE